MSKKTAAPAARLNIPPELFDILTKGIPRSVDSDPAGESALAKFAEALDIETHLRYANRAFLYGRWRNVPSVTLEQGAWLLLGRDPWEPNSSEPEAPERFQESRYRALVNLLECEVAEQRLRPVGKFVPGFTRRFSLKAVALTAKRINMNPGAAEQLLLLLDGKPYESVAVPYWTQRTAKRVAVHLALSNILKAKAPAITTPLAPKTNRNRRRRQQADPLNLQIAMPESDYNDQFRQLYPELHKGQPEYEITDGMLEDDREALNIKFKRGRRFQATTAPPKTR